MAKRAAPSGPRKGYTCHDKALTGSGPGFKSSQEESEEAAIKDWLDKASAIFADADWNTAKDAGMGCVKQGLYSKCFAEGVPCHPRPKESARCHFRDKIDPVACAIRVPD